MPKDRGDSAVTRLSQDFAARTVIHIVAAVTLGIAHRDRPVNLITLLRVRAADSGTEFQVLEYRVHSLDNTTGCLSSQWIFKILFLKPCLCKTAQPFLRRRQQQKGYQRRRRLVQKRLLKSYGINKAQPGGQCQAKLTCGDYAVYSPQIRKRKGSENSKPSVIIDLTCNTIRIVYLSRFS